MTGAAVFAMALLTVLVLGSYLAQAAVLVVVVAAHVGWTLLCAILWLACFAAAPRAALRDLKRGIEAAEAEAAIRRLNARHG